MKMVITGALGHIGSRLTRVLAKAFSNAEIVMVDNLRTNRYCSLFNLPPEGRYRFIEADILDADLKEILKGVNAVIHLAAITDAVASFANPVELEEVNYHGTLKVAEACMEAKCALIHMSSTSVYGTQAGIVDENCDETELQPQSPYAEVKLKEEAALAKLGQESLRFITLRNGTICGTSPGMRFHTAVNKFCWQAITGQPLTVWKTALHQKRPYLCLSDAVRAIVYLLENNRFDGKIYNILTDNLTVQDIIGFIKHYIRDVRVEYVDSVIMNQLSYEVSSTRFRNTGFQFTGSLEDSIRDTISLLSYQKMPMTI